MRIIWEEPKFKLVKEDGEERVSDEVWGSVIYVEAAAWLGTNQAEISEKSMLATASNMCKGLQFGKELNNSE